VTETRPSILVSFAYRKAWAQVCSLPHWREVVLDSGAYTAHKSGGRVDIVELADWFLSERARDPRVTELFTLDVIGGDWRESLRNTEELHRRGCPVIPVYHVGEPTDVLRCLARDYPKVALGGAVCYPPKMEWAALCFRTVWPTPLHGLGFGDAALLRLPWHSVDTSAWDLRPRAFGQWATLGHSRVPTRSTRTTKSGLRCEVDRYLREEDRARRFWNGRMPPGYEGAPSLRLALAPDNGANSHNVRSLAPTT
jgi:hypothetical protein